MAKRIRKGTPAPPPATLVRVDGKRFGPGTRVVLDGHAFFNCEFESCEIAYWGGPFALVSGNRIWGKLSFRFEGCAQRTVALLTALCTAVPSALHNLIGGPAPSEIQ